MPPTLDSLLPEYRIQYDALMPEIERMVRADLQRRGMSYSGQAADALAKAEAELLAELGGKSAETRARQYEAERQRQWEGGQASENRSESRRAQNLGLIGSGVGALTGLGGLYAMNRGATSPNLFVKDGQPYTYDAKTNTATPVQFAGATGADGINIPGMPSAPGGGGFYGSTPPVGAAGGGAGGREMQYPLAGQGPDDVAGPSMWQRAGGLGGLAAGAAGGFTGSRLAELTGGRTSRAGTIGAGVGGAAGVAVPLAMGYNNPGAMGLGALVGSFGGGLLGNLFR